LRLRRGGRAGQREIKIALGEKPPAEQGQCPRDLLLRIRQPSREVMAPDREKSLITRKEPAEI